MSDNLNAELERVTVEAFSMLGFMFPLDEQPCGQQGTMGDDALVVQVTFCGPVEGLMRLRAEPRLVEMLAANMTGEDEPPPPAQQLDALKEMLNVICGNMLPAIDGQSVFDVHAPEAGDQWLATDVAGDESAGDDNVAARACVMLEGGQVEVLMTVAAPAKA